jgi:hypothetical protein
MTLCYPSDTDWGCALSDEEIAALDPDLKEVAEANAWYTLAALTAYQIAVCPLTVRPCGVDCQGRGTRMASIVRSTGMFSPHIDQNGSWVNACGCASGDCGCSVPCEAVLPGVVGAITEVWVDGAVLDPDAYRVDNGNRLVRVDGGCWPLCQDMSVGNRDDDAFSVTYYQGSAPDKLSQRAAGQLAVEFYKACQNKECKLPARVQTVTRMGVTYQISSDMFADGSTGIAEVDAFIGRYNPMHLKSAPVVSSPDLRRARVPSWGQ